MSKRIKNQNCPLQAECERKCEHIGSEENCDYYRNNNVDQSVRLSDILNPDLDDYEDVEDFEDSDFVYTEEVTGKIVQIPIELLHHHHDNPRKEIGDITELTDSIKAKGILQNLTVVPYWFKITGVGCDDPEQQAAMGYLVVIGNRRLEAAKAAGLKTLPCIIAKMTQAEQVQTMLLENMQRTDLTVYEQAQGFQMMIDFGDTVDTVAEKTGFSKTTVRRRLKMAELNQDTLKKISERQLSLMDFDRISEIEDIELRNKVLATMGTNNFESELNRALAAQKAEEQKSKWLNALTEKGIKEIPESEVFASKYASVGSYRFDINNPDVLNEIIEEGVEYFYAIAYSNWVYIRKNKVVTAEEEAEEAERERRNAEQRAKREALEDAAERAFECRKKFIKETSNATAKKFIKEIISYTISYAWTPNIYGRFDRDLYAEQMGVEVPEGSLNYGLVQYETENAPEYALLCYAYALWNDSATNDYHDYQYMHHENTKLNALYSLLEKLGYEMSDEEIALRDGTSELFVKPESADEDDFDDEDDFEEDSEEFETELIEDEDPVDEDEISDEDAEDDDILEKLRAEYGGENDDE